MTPTSTARHALAAALAFCLGSGALAEPVHGLAVFGPEELKYPADFEHFDYVNPDAPVGGPWSTGLGGVSFDSLNTFILKGNPAAFMGLTYDTLMASAGDEPASMYGLLAKSAEVAEDGTAVTFHLDDRARFRDGSPVTAEDVRWTFEALVEKGLPTFRNQFSAVANVEVLDERTIRFDFDPQAAIRDMPTTVAGMPVLSKAWWDGRDFAESGLDAPMGSGPYEVADVDPGRSMTFRRRDDYWGWGLPVNVGRWNFGTIKIEYYRDRSVAFEGFKSGNYLFQEEFWSKLWATAYEFPAIQKGWVVRETIPDNRPAGTQGYWFNLRREKFQDPRVRRAIAEVFDFEWSNKTLFYNLYTRTDSFFEGGPMEAEGKPTEGELRILKSLAAELPSGVLEDEAYVPPVTDGSGRPREGLKNAARLLEEAGYTMNGRTRIGPDGRPLTIEFLLTGTGFERITNPFVKNLKKLGIDSTVRTIDTTQYEQRTDEFDFDIVVERYSMSLTPGVELRNIFDSRSADQQGSVNLTGLKNPAVDELIDRIERADSREELTNAVKALDRVLRALHIWVPQWSKGVHTIAYWDIFGQPGTKPEYERGVIDLWWVDQEKYEKMKPHIGG